MDEDGTYHSQGDLDWDVAERVFQSGRFPSRLEQHTDGLSILQEQQTRKQDQTFVEKQSEMPPFDNDCEITEEIQPYLAQNLWDVPLPQIEKNESLGVRLPLSFKEHVQSFLEFHESIFPKENFTGIASSPQQTPKCSHHEEEKEDHSPACHLPLGSPEPVTEDKQSTTVKLRVGIQSQQQKQWTIEDDDQFFEMHRMIGNKWRELSLSMNQKTENQVKNFYFSNLRKITKQIVHACQVLKFSAAQSQILLQNAQEITVRNSELTSTLKENKNRQSTESSDKISDALKRSYETLGNKRSLYFLGIVQQIMVKLHPTCSQTQGRIDKNASMIKRQNEAYVIEKLTKENDICADDVQQLIQWIHGYLPQQAENEKEISEGLMQSSAAPRKVSTDMIFGQNEQGKSLKQIEIKEELGAIIDPQKIDLSSESDNIQDHQLIAQSNHTEDFDQQEANNANHARGAESGVSHYMLAWVPRSTESMDRILNQLIHQLHQDDHQMHEDH